MYRRLQWLLLFVTLGLGMPQLRAAESLEANWNNPPQEARLKAYWWWLNGNVTKESLTHDLEQMQAKGFGGAVIFDADGSSQDGNAKVPAGPTFASPEWRELFKHTVREADRLGLGLSLNIQSGWNLGGPTVKVEDAPKKLVWTETRLQGGTKVVRKLETSKGKDNFYRDLAVLAYRVTPTDLPARKSLQKLPEKALLRAFKPSSAPDTSSLLQDIPGTAGEEDARAQDVVDLTTKFSRDGELSWDVPAGDWVVLRFGFTLNDRCRVSTSSGDWKGYALDPYDAGAFERYWDAVVAPLIADVAPFAGKALKYLHTDSWEIGVANWTPTLAREFQQRRGYELLPWLPVIAGKIVNSREESNRFLHDFRRTMGDLAIDNHYKIFRDRAHQHGLLIHPESGGPHAVPIDAQQCLGFNDAPMSEFWAWSPRHRVGDANRYFVKQPASAAHTYGRKLVMAEGFTTIGPHWQETLWDNLKPSFDKALTEGLNLLVWHAFVSSPKEQGIPGQQYFAGAHLNPNVTWWDKSGPFFDYINRCQALLQQGLPYADVLYYYGDQVPNFTQHRRTDPARVGAGYDYDVITEEALLTRVTVKEGRIVLPDGVSYRLLVLVDREVISLPVLRKVKELVAAGATVIGSRPKQASGLKDAALADAEVKQLAAELWGGGRIVSNKSARQVLLAQGVRPDFEWKPQTRADAAADLEYIHRSAGGAEIYFVANLSNLTAQVEATFRVTGQVPELWNPVTGERQIATAYQIKDGRTTLPLAFAPCGSWFVVFRSPSAQHPARTTSNTPELKPLVELAGPWTVKFDSRWGGPAAATFSQLVSWTERPEAGIKYYSGTAVYAKSFELAEPVRAARVWLDLGEVRELAKVRVNGKSCGIVWAPPFRVDITDAVKLGANQLEVEVVNFWPNRIIGDAALRPAQRLTQTNIRKLTKDTKLMESGLLGPVRLLRASIGLAAQNIPRPEPSTLSLWPDQPPGKVSGKAEVELPARGDNVRRITHVDQPTITVFPAALTNQPAPAVVICPGGGYGILAINKEGTEVAEWLNRIGVTAVVLKYRVPDNRDGAFMDAQRALRLVRYHAKDWNIDPQRVGMMGFSAGGHLTARLSTGYESRGYPDVDAADQQSCRPDFAMLIYPAYLADAPGQLAGDLKVTAQTPRTFLVHTKDDKNFVNGSVVYDQALRAAQVASAFHLFERGGHGYGLQPAALEVAQWPELCRQWLEQQGRRPAVTP